MSLLITLSYRQAWYPHLLTFSLEKSCSLLVSLSKCRGLKVLFSCWLGFDDFVVGMMWGLSLVCGYWKVCASSVGIGMVVYDVDGSYYVESLLVFEGDWWYCVFLYLMMVLDDCYLELNLSSLSWHFVYSCLRSSRIALVDRVACSLYSCYANKV